MTSHFDIMRQKLQCPCERLRRSLPERLRSILRASAQPTIFKGPVLPPTLPQIQRSKLVIPFLTPSRTRTPFIRSDYAGSNRSSRVNRFSTSSARLAEPNLPGPAAQNMSGRGRFSIILPSASSIGRQSASNVSSDNERPAISDEPVRQPNFRNARRCRISSKHQFSGRLLPKVRDRGSRRKLRLALLSGSCLLVILTICEC